MEELIAKHKDVNPFLLKKWERVFSMFFDRNASAEVDWGDFYLVTRYVRDIYGAESDQMKFAKSSMKSLWEGLVGMADSNKDEVIQLDEWVEVLKKSNMQTQPKWFHDYMMFMFKLFDVSADEKLDLAEYTDGMTTYGFSVEEAHKAFHKFAVDAKGSSVPSIDSSQFKKLWLEYFYSTDSCALGNYLFGEMK